MITLYRGINAETPELLQKYLNDMKDNSILPRTYSGNALNGNGYTHSTDLATAREYANDGILNGKPYGAVTKIEVPKNRFLKMNYENGKSENNFIENATLRGVANAEEIGKQNFHNILTKNGIYGSHNLENQYTIMNNDAMRGMSTIEKYANGDLLTDQPADKKVPSENNQYISKMLKDTGADAYLGTPKIVYHGSPTTGIEEFDLNMAGKNTHSGERAIYFTDDYPTAEDFSYERLPSNSMFVNKRGKKGEVYTRQLNLKNPLDFDNLTDEQIYELYDYIDPRMAQLTDRDKFIKTLQEARKAKNGQMVKAQLDLNKLAGSGYDGFVASMYPGENNVKEYGVFDTSAISKIPEKMNIPEVQQSLYGGGYGRLADDAKKIGSVEVAPIDPETLPGAYDKMRDYLADYKNAVPKAIGKPASKITKADLVSLLEDYGYDTEGTKWELWNTAQDMLEDQLIDELYEENGEVFARFLGGHRGGAGITKPGEFRLGSGNRANYLDSVYSDRLGIGRSHTPMADTLNKYNRYGMDTAGGDYMTNGIGINLNSWGNEGEGGVSTIAHERMHAWQDQGKGWNYDERFRDAYDELRKDLEPYFHDREQILKDHPNSNSELDYWARENEQEARMLQSYLENGGFTKTGRKPEWGDEINSAFDKFFDRLRELSKKGVALPAILGIVVASKYLPKKEDKKS